MSLIKDPSGSFYLESDQFNVDYEENSIKIDGEYTVNVSASGYVAQEVQVTADEDQILTITLAQE